MPKYKVLDGTIGDQNALVGDVVELTEQQAARALARGTIALVKEPKPEPKPESKPQAQQPQAKPEQPQAQQPQAKPEQPQAQQPQAQQPKAKP